MEVVQGGENVFEDIGFDRAEAVNLRVRADLMLDLRKYIEVNGWTQRQAAAAFWRVPTTHQQSNERRDLSL